MSEVLSALSYDRACGGSADRTRPKSPAFGRNRVEAALTVLQDEMQRQVGHGRLVTRSQLADELGIAERKLRGIAHGGQRPCLDEALDIATSLPEPCVNKMLGCYDWCGAHPLADDAPHPLDAAAKAALFAAEVVQAHSPSSPGGAAFTADERRSALDTLDVTIAMLTSLRRTLAP